MEIRHDLGIVPRETREELERRVVLAADRDQESSVVLLLNRDTFESMFARDGVRVMVSDLVPRGNAFVVDLQAIRRAVESRQGRPVLGVVVNDG